MYTSTRPVLVIMTALSLTLVPSAVLAADEPTATPVILEPQSGSLVHDVATQEPVAFEPAPQDGSIAAPTSLGVGPGISVGEAREAPAGQILLINGALLVDPDGEVRLWDALAESYPPQGSGPYLVVEGLDEAAIGWTEVGGVRWSEGVQLLGRRSDDTLVIDPLAL